MSLIRPTLILVLIALFTGCSDNQKAAEHKAPSVQKELTPEEKFAKLQKEAEAGGAEAQYKLGQAYMLGEGVPKDEARAMDWYQKAASQGDVTAQKSLGDIYAKGISVPKDAAKAFEWFQKAAVQGDAEAQKIVGMFYRDGFGIIKNADKALEWLQKAAAQGNVDAEISIGMMYASGDGVPEDKATALEWFQKAAIQGDAVAQSTLGLIYANGTMGAPKDATKAVEWLQKASAQGYAPAQYALGEIYAEGNGVPKDAAKAFEWFQKAAVQGDAVAQWRIGAMYLNGNGVPRDVSKGVEWYQKSAAQGNAHAQFFIGMLYKNGQDVSRDLVRGYAWLNLASAQGHEGAKVYRDKAEGQMTPAQRAEGQHLSSNWKKGDTLQVSSDNAAGSISPDGKPVKRSTGTGFAVSHNGHALTNHHVIEGCAEVRISGREGIAKAIASDSVNDLALLQLPGRSNDVANLNPDFGKLRQGEDIVVYGYPLNSLLSSGGNLTPGIISALTGLDNNTNQIQITAPIQGGSSGSPVMDKKGNVVGLVSGKLDIKAVRLTGGIPQNVNFAVNGQTVKAFLDANKVNYKTGGGFFSREKSNADIAEEARKWTVVLECWK